MKRFRPDRPGADAIIAGAGGDPTRPYVLYVSTVHPRKNLSALRSATTALAARGLPHRLVIVAAPPPDRHDHDDLFAAAGAELPGFPGSGHPLAESGRPGTGGVDERGCRVLAFRV